MLQRGPKNFPEKIKTQILARTDLITVILHLKTLGFKTKIIKKILTTKRPHAIITKNDKTLYLWRDNKDFSQRVWWIGETQDLKKATKIQVLTLHAVVSRIENFK